MRAWEITFLIVVLAQVSQVFVASIGLFPDDYLGIHGAVVTNSTNASSPGYTTGNYDEKTNTLIADQKAGNVVDSVTLGVAFFVSGFMMILQVAAMFITVLPTLLIFFHCPLPIALVVQALVYYSLIWSYAQWKAGRAGAMIQ